MHMVARKNAQLTLLLKAILDRTIMLVSIGITIFTLKNHNVVGNGRRRKFSIMDRIPAQIQNMSDLVRVSDEDCKNKLRIDRNSFYRLCDLLQNNSGLKPSKYISVYEKVVMFLSILAHHSNNRCVKFQFKRSGQTVSKQFHDVLHSVLKIYYLLLVKPQPGCLGALYGTYIDVHIPTIDKGRYRNRKGLISVNVLGDRKDQPQIRAYCVMQ
ncbi:hypothetical protein ACS0TY_010420 [Phlomoides rotata]